MNMKFLIMCMGAWLAGASNMNAEKFYENHTTDAHGLQYAFPSSYTIARDEFRLIGHEAEKALKAQLGSYKIPNRANEDLTVDHLFIPSAKKNGKLLIISSGLHGAEAYAGHPIEMTFLRQVLSKPDDFPFDILVIHGLNPYGARHFRRVNENNVDLNRNFATPEEFKTENKSYRKLHKLFNPGGPADAKWMAQIGFYTRAFWHKLTQGKKLILNGLSGQYQDPTGPFYGGNTPQAETLYAQYLVKRYASFATQIYHVDLHTGFGAKAHVHLLADKAALDAQPGAFEKLFDGYKIESGSDKDFYPTTGNFVEWTRKAFPDKLVVPITFEMGTMDSQTMLGGARSLWTMVIENQGAHNGFNSKQSQLISASDFEELFNPQESSWQDAVVHQSMAILQSTITRFKAM